MPNSKINLSIRVQKIENLIQVRELQLHKNRNRRLGVGLLLGVFCFIAMATNEKLYLALFLVGLPIFIYFVKATKNYQRHLKSLKAWKSFLTRQTQRYLGQIKSKGANHHPEEISDRSALIRDLDLVGPHSLLQHIDECFSEDAQQELTNKLLSQGSMDLIQVKKFHQQILDLYKSNWILTRIKIASEQEDPVRYDLITPLLKNKLAGPSMGLSLFYLLSYFSCWFLIYLGLKSTLALNPMLPLTFLFFVVLGIKGKNQELMTQIYALLLELSKFKKLSTELERGQSQLCHSLPHYFKNPMSQVLSGLERWIAFLNLRSYSLADIIANMLLPWDIIIIHLAENWRKKQRQHLPIIFEELKNFEILTSATFIYTFRNCCLPQFIDKGISFKGIYHPQLGVKAIKNDFDFSQKLGLITGSNMSGKSTFLRSVGINQALALAGFPVFADNFKTEFKPVKTCLRIHDSLDEGYSSFYYEVKRMSQILKQAKSEQTFIYLIDELFRGTNNKERLIGGQSILLGLLDSSKGFGFVSTHDIELTQIAKDRPDISLWHFVDDIKDGQLHFDYQIKSGPCPSTNALQIMQNEGLPVSSNKPSLT